MSRRKTETLLPAGTPPVTPPHASCAPVPSPPLNRTTLSITGPSTEESEVEIEQVRLTDVQYFGRPFWLLTTSCLVVYGTVLPFNNIASTFLQTRDFMPATDPWDRV